jgi:hypothetical protein
MAAVARKEKVMLVHQNALLNLQGNIYFRKFCNRIGAQAKYYSGFLRHMRMMDYNTGCGNKVPGLVLQQSRLVVAKRTTDIYV